MKSKAEQAVSKLQAEGIATVFGNNTLDITARNALVNLKVAERGDTPVGGMICYVISLERHQARLQSFLQQFDSSDLAALELRRFRAVDAASVWRHARALVYEPALARLSVVLSRGFRDTHAELSSLAAIGCALSHLHIWVDILDDAGSPARQRYLVMEDDASLPRRLLAPLNKALQGIPADWDILLLGCRTPQLGMVTTYATYVDIRLFQGTHAYLITRAAIRKIFENGALPMRVQIDAYLSVLAQAKKLKIYTVSKQLVGVMKRWGSSIQLDHDFERSRAKLTYDYPFEMVPAWTAVESLQMLRALRSRCEFNRAIRDTAN